MSKRALVLSYFVVLAVLHQDFWWKADATLVLGVLPISLAYHVAWTLFVAVGWFLAGRYCWPVGLDAEPGSPAAPTVPASPPVDPTAAR